MSAQNTQVDYYYRRRDGELDAYAAAMFLDPVKTPEQELIESDEIECVLAELSELPARIEYAIRMYYGIGCEPNTLQQVADRFGIATKTIRDIIAKGERRLTFRLRKKLRPEQYWIDRRERERLQREERARDAEREAEREADWARLRAEFRTIEVPEELIRQARILKERDDALLELNRSAPPTYEARPYDPWASVEQGLHLEHYEQSQVDDMKQRLRSLAPARLARLRDYVIQNNLELMMQTFGLELSGDNDNGEA